MTGRTVYYFKPDDTANERFAGANLGVFHKWGTWQGSTVAIVEDAHVGKIFMCHPEAIRFDERYSTYIKRVQEGQRDSQEVR